MKQIWLFFALVLSSSGTYAQLINADFETGDLTGWQTLVEGEAFPVSIESGSVTTEAGTINPSPDGNYMVFTSQDGPGRSFLWQEFTPRIWQVTDPNAFNIYFDIAINNGATAYYTPDPMSLDYTGDPNQQARIDILKPGASITTVDPNDIIVELFQTQPGDPLIQDWQRVTKDVTSEMAAYVDQTLTLRLVQVDNQLFFNLALDNVSVGNRAPYDDGSATPVPALPPMALWLLSVLLTLLALRRRQSRQA